MDWMDYVRMTLPWPATSSHSDQFVLIASTLCADERFAHGDSEDDRTDRTNLCIFGLMVHRYHLLWVSLFIPSPPTLRFTISCNLQ